MSEHPDNLVLVYLRRIDTLLDGIEHKLEDRFQ
jgi:hypothetical protein